MAGVLPATSTRGGLLGQFEQRRPRVAGFLDNNSMALMQFGMGLLSGGNRGEAWANASQGLAYGSQADHARRQRTKEEEEKAAQEQAVNDLLMSPEFVEALGGLSPQEQAFLRANPEMAREFAMSEIQRRTTPAAGPDPTDDIQEFEYARQNGFTGTFQEWQMLRPPSTSITLPGQPTIGTIPPGYAATQDPTTGEWTMAPIAGGPAAAEAAAAADAAARAAADEAVIADAFVGTIDRAIGLAANADGGLPTTGLIGNLLAGVPMASQARELANELQTIKSRTSLEEINRMRQNSPTGAALGNATNADMTRLESAIVTLDQAVGPVALTAALERLQEAYLDLVHGAGNWTRDEGGGVRVRAAGAAPAAGGAVDLRRDAPGAGGAVVPYEGMVIENDAGERLILRNGQWVPQ